MSTRFPELLRIGLLGAAALATDARVSALAPGSDPGLRPGDTIAIVGNALAERMQHHGWLELELQSRLPDHGLTVRNLGFGADELAVHQRTLNFGKFTADGMESTLPNERFVPWDRYLDHCDADIVFAFFGYNESFAGRDGLDAFRRDLETFVDHVRAQRYNGESAPRLVLFTPIPHEYGGRPTDEERGALLQAYGALERAVGRELGVTVVDLYPRMIAAYEEADEPLTINGIHLNERGNEELAEIIADALVGGTRDPALDLDALRAAIREKNRLWFNRYRVTDGYNVYGGRSRQVYDEAGGERRFSNFDVLQREMDHLDVLVRNRDRRIHALARGRDLAVDDSNAPELIRVATNKRGDGPDGAHVMLDATEALERMTPAPGMRVELFASEDDFPELANPVQMAFDPRGRLWVAVWPTYTHWTPTLEMNDKLIVLEDTDGDGRADECTTFAGDLHNPTGFEFWNGGVLLAQVPDLMFLEDTDGDGRADRRERLLHGLSSADTHHSANSFVLGPDGALYFQEGTFHRSQIESPFGPVRNHNGCVWRFEPRTFRVERYAPYDFANPHGHVFDRWGQDFVTDGTGNQNYFALPFSGHTVHPQKHARYFTFFQQRSRPAAATEILSSAHFPPANQQNYLIANVIGFQGIFQYELEDDGSGFTANEVDPIVQSSDPNFRPVDIEIAPDGSLYFIDWHNPLIGHLQHHIRDPSRDATHGRVYRVTYPGRPLIEPPAIAGQPIEALLELLRSPDDRIRYRTRIELSARDSQRVIAMAAAWARALDPADPDFDHHRLEALWLIQQHDGMDRQLLVGLLAAEDPRARAAAVRVLRYGRHRLPDALELLAPRALDRHPRVRLEAVVAASFFPSERAAEIALDALRRPTDAFLDYALGETLKTLEPQWKAALQAGRPLVDDNEAGIAYLLERVGADELPSLPRAPAVLTALLTRHGIGAELRADAAAELARARGTTPAEQLLAAIRILDAGAGPHAGHVLHELFELLDARAEGSSRDELADLARGARQGTTRAHAVAAWIERSGSADLVWSDLERRPGGLRALLDAVALVDDRDLRAGLFERVRPLMFALPAGTPARAHGAGTGLAVAFFEPAPRDARRETLAELTASATLVAPNVTLDLDPAQGSDSYALRFSGTLHAPSTGAYTFTTRSDDGSRLYVGDRCVVDNDGDHGATEKDGAIELGAGPHPFCVTYYERGGAHSLEVLWAGPGIERQPIPSAALGRDDARALRAAAIRAMAHIPGRDERKLEDAARLIGDDALLGPALELVRSVDARSSERLRPLVGTLSAYVAGLPPMRRTSPDVGLALELARELATALPTAEAERALAELDGLGGSQVLIRTVPHQMLYDLTEFAVRAGQPVGLVFQNNDVMPHNLVITLPGEMAAVGEAAERMGIAGEGRDFVPDHPSILWHTRLVLPGESVRLEFVAPDELGDYPFVCTYPGHWRVMNGVMRVVRELGDGATVTRRPTTETTASLRSFVRDWKLADLEARFVEGWEEGRSFENGRRMFSEAGCIQCHTIGDEGAVGGPALSAVGAKYRDAELLAHVLEPSRDVLADYRFWGFELDDGPDVIGRVLSDDGAELVVVPALLEPEKTVVVPKESVVERWDTRLSPMPTGLLVTLDEEEILDLVYFLQESARDTDEQVSTDPHDPWVVYEGGDGPGRGRHVVLLSGDDEYRSEEALPMLGKILAERHGFRCTVLFATNPETGEIQPDEQRHIPGLHHLDDADLLVCFLRFRQLPDEDMRHFVDYVVSGKPILGIRTATHAFNYADDSDSRYRDWGWRSRAWPGGFGQQVLGDTWVAHHGKHGSQSTRGVVEVENAAHPILNGVDDVWGPTDVYAITHLPDDATVLLRGQVLDGMEPTSPPAEGPPNDPMMPLVWTRELEGQRIVCSTIGASTDCESEGLRRLFVNAVYWGVGLEAPEEADVEYVGEYSPTPFGFGTYTRGVRPADHALE